MPTFRFRLTPVLHLRENARDERRAALAEAMRAEEVLAEQMAEKRVQIVTLGGELAKERAIGEINVERMIQGQRYQAILRAELAMLGEQAKRVTAEVERRRELLVAADRDVRVLEQLREKQLERFVMEEARREIKFLDDVAGQRAATREWPA
ncbi:MAG: flagellar export protein FliJ [Planctomycetia bacterium]|nr:flagellar export protein FliJ [Planctomycetia bacterium]